MNLNSGSVQLYERNPLLIHREPHEINVSYKKMYQNYLKQITVLTGGTNNDE